LSDADHDWHGITNKEKNKPARKGQRATDNLYIRKTCETDVGKIPNSNNEPVHNPYFS
jgi:hypothetical protein